MIAVLGAGNGGLALTAHLLKGGHDVVLWNRSSHRLREALGEQNTLQIRDFSNASEWQIRIPKITYSLEEATKSAKLIFIVTPGTAHQELSGLLVPHLTGDQAIILMPGRTFGSRSFFEEYARYDLREMSCFEAQSILMTCRVFNRVLEIYAKKNEILFSSAKPAPAKHIRLVQEILPDFKWETNFHTVTLNNIGAMLHPLPTLLNAARIEAGEKFYFYSQGISPAIAGLIEKLDQERRLVCEALGAEFIGVKSWLNREYGSVGNTLFESLTNTTAYQTIPAPTTIQHRYLIDDTLTGLVPLYSAGQAKGIDMPLTKNVIDLVSSLLNRNLSEDGRKFAE